MAVISVQLLHRMFYLNLAYFTWHFDCFVINLCSFSVPQSNVKDIQEKSSRGELLEFRFKFQVHTTAFLEVKLS
jgi:hypothetical protein